jgi:hypothetical protein
MLRNSIDVHEVLQCRQKMLINFCCQQKGDYAQIVRINCIGLVRCSATLLSGDRLSIEFLNIRFLIQRSPESSSGQPSLIFDNNQQAPSSLQRARIVASPVVHTSLGYSIDRMHSEVVSLR